MKILIRTPFREDSYATLIRSCGGSPIAVFKNIGTAIATRYFDQINTIAPTSSYLDTILDQIWSTVHEVGLPTPIKANEMGDAVDADYDRLGELTNGCLKNLPINRAEDQIRTLCIQLLIALLSPEFRSCRQSYTKEEPDGSCLRQNNEHCEERISGTHCEDCPYFTSMTQDQHRKLLSKIWSKNSISPFESYMNIFLPEDFRSLRIFWHLYLRHHS